MVQNVAQKAMQELRDNGVFVSGWISTRWTLPEEHKEVLTCGLGGFIEIQSIEQSYWENQNGDWSDIDDVIAWMPLPNPYESRESEDKK